MTFDAVDDAIAKLSEAGLLPPDRLRGCTEAEIGEVEARSGVQLPPIYRKFLARMGRAAGDFLVGTDHLYPEILTLREQADALLRECKSPLTLDRDDFVFAVHQGYQFLFFKSGTSDPEVFHYLEGEEEFRKVAGSYSEWIIRCAADEAAAYQKTSK